MDITDLHLPSSFGYTHYLCVCGLGSPQHFRDSTGQVLGSTQQLLPISSFIIHERCQQFNTLWHLCQVGGDCGDSTAHRCVVRLCRITWEQHRRMDGLMGKTGRQTDGTNSVPHGFMSKARIQIWNTKSSQSCEKVSPAIPESEGALTLGQVASYRAMIILHIHFAQLCLCSCMSSQTLPKHTSPTHASAKKVWVCPEDWESTR